jgi:hypothetical protein
MPILLVIGAIIGIVFRKQISAWCGMDLDAAEEARQTIAESKKLIDELQDRAQQRNELWGQLGFIEGSKEAERRGLLQYEPSRPQGTR